MTLKKWVVVDQTGLAVDVFQAEQSYIDNYETTVVKDEGYVTPPWWSVGVTFVDVTGVLPQPTVGWTHSGTTWTPPTTPPPGPTPEQKQRVTDDAFITSMVAVIKGGGSLTQDQRDRLMVLQLDRTAVLS